ncbi:Hypothetical protein NTJ_02450 [Nesidiocoris tenuis]|uniref:Uncharacterized protein n=1 Tax=Nesidiocoris tenuis TaxID=355587 RepID=A0ABN7AC74_9HEMI|nr:Hypothetical protein NTJ_02450 [Nesidiocoris tenuis]
MTPIRCQGGTSPVTLLAFSGLHFPDQSVFHINSTGRPPPPRTAHPRCAVRDCQQSSPADQILTLQTRRCSLQPSDGRI